MPAAREQLPFLKKALANVRKVRDHEYSVRSCPQPFRVSWWGTEADGADGGCGRAYIFETRVGFFCNSNRNALRHASL